MAPDVYGDGYNPARCKYHEDEMRAQNKRINRVEKSLYTTNGEPGLLETVRGMARVQRWHTYALLALLLLQISGDAKGYLLRALEALLR